MENHHINRLEQSTFVEIIEEQTARALWEVKNVIDCVPDELWDKKFTYVERKVR